MAANRLVLLAALVCCNPAFGQDGGWFAGAGVGQAVFNPERQSAITGGPLTAGDDRDRAYRLLVGYRISRWLAFAGGYADFGRAEHLAAWPSNVVGVCVTGQFSPCNGKVRQSTRVRAYLFSLELALPLSTGIDLFVKGGVALAASRVEHRDGTGSASESRQTELRSSYGLGGRYRVAANAALTAEWSRLGKAGLDAGGLIVDQYLLGLEYAF